MSRSTRSNISVGTFFVTVCHETQEADGLDLLRRAYASVTQLHPVTCHAVVILPDHIHAVWTLPRSDVGYSAQWDQIKEAFSQSLPRAPVRGAAKWLKYEKAIRQNRLWGRPIRSKADLQRRVDYCHFDPVRHGLTKTPEGWAYSTVHQMQASDMILT